MFIYMGYLLSESGIADDLYWMFHVWMGPVKRRPCHRHHPPHGAGLGHERPLGCRDGDRRNDSAPPNSCGAATTSAWSPGVIQAGSSLGILVPPSVVLVLYATIARQPVGQLWLAGVFPGLMMAALFVLYIAVRCKLQPKLGPVLPPEERDFPLREKLRLLRAGLLPIFIFAAMMVPFVRGWTSLVESSALGALVATPRRPCPTAHDAGRL